MCITDVHVDGAVQPEAVLQDSVLGHVNDGQILHPGNKVLSHLNRFIGL